MQRKYILRFAKCKTHFIGCQLFFSFFKKFSHFFALAMLYQKSTLAKPRWQSFLFSEVPDFFWPGAPYEVSGTKVGFISAFRQRFFPNTPAKISDTRVSEHEVLHEIA